MELTSKKRMTAVKTARNRRKSEQLLNECERKKEEGKRVRKRNKGSSERIGIEAERDGAKPTAALDRGQVYFSTNCRNVCIVDICRYPECMLLILYYFLYYFHSISLFYHTHIEICCELIVLPCCNLWNTNTYHDNIQDTHADYWILIR